MHILGAREVVLVHFYELQVVHEVHKRNLYISIPDLSHKVSRNVRLHVIEFSFDVNLSWDFNP